MNFYINLSNLRFTHLAGVGNQPSESWFLPWLVGFLVGFWLVFLTNHHQPQISEVGFLVGWFGWLVFGQFLPFYWF